MSFAFYFIFSIVIYAYKIGKKDDVEIKEVEEQIIGLICYDELTKLHNYKYFNEVITGCINNSKGENKYFAIMCLNINNFKLINYIYGHEAGDVLLKEFSLRIKSIICENSIFARVSGDEFLLLMTNLRKEADIEKITFISEKIISILKEPFLIGDKENFISVSMGVTFYPNDGQDNKVLIRNADIALNEAKQLGRNNIQFFSQEMKTKVTQRIDLRNNLYEALRKEELLVYYQPQVDINSNKIIGFEALLRWKIDNHLFISPTEFIPLAEETGLIVPIGYWVIKTACERLKQWHDSGFHNLSMAINLSYNQLNEREFVNTVASILEEVKLEPCFLEFEITERITLKGIEESIKVLKDIKNMGIKISIDDFGTEYSSFMNIKRLPVDKIKIAIEFVQGLLKNSTDTAIVSSIMELSHDLKFLVIAEGVETMEQFEYLRSIKCDVVQGYYCYKPMTDIEIENVLYQN